MIPELVKAHWWNHVLHSSRARRLCSTLLRHGGPNLAVIVVPWTLEPARPETIIESEEPGAEQPASPPKRVYAASPQP